MSDESRRTKRIAIIGAGMAGLAAARLLREQGINCTVFEKSRGLGGRMATRRIKDLTFDHGAQYFTARGERFRALVAQWQEQGDVTHWLPDGFVGTPGMTAPARALAIGCETILDYEVKALVRGQSGWSVHAGQSDLLHSDFDAVLLAIPAPQAMALLASADIAFPPLAQAHYAPCLALMLAFEDELDFVETHRRYENGPIAWIARDSSKPGRTTLAQTFVVHAGPEWSKAHLDETPQTILEQLLPQALELIGARRAPFYATAHRWRYALVEQTAGVACVWDDQANIGACGDYCLGPRVEAAFESGEALAKSVLISIQAERRTHD
ncbi:MAG: FAD-binding protein [Methylocystaceae bacterium]|nr:FAD-binding protein [Methylocystaceae bacterium]